MIRRSNAMLNPETEDYGIITGFAWCDPRASKNLKDLRTIDRRITIRGGPWDRGLGEPRPPRGPDNQSDGWLAPPRPVGCRDTTCYPTRSLFVS